MRALVLDPPSSGLSEFLERRRRLGLDRLDEVWEGVLHIVPAPRGEHADIAQQLAAILGGPARAAGLVPTMAEFNIGESEYDYRVPDGGVHRSRPSGVWLLTAAIAIEILSPGDETWEKLPFYAAHGVDELLIVDRLERIVHWRALQGTEYVVRDRSGLIGLGAAELAERLDWP